MRLGHPSSTQAGRGPRFSHEVPYIDLQRDGVELPQHLARPAGRSGSKYLTR